MEELASLHRYWIYANRMREYFYRTLAESGLDQMPPGHKDFAAMWLHLNDPGIFKTYWYGTLFAVIEGYRELRLQDNEIDQLLTSDHVDELRRFRNGSFHYQREWMPEKILKMDTSDECVNWVRSLHKRLGEFLLEKVKGIFPEERRKELEVFIDDLVAQQRAAADAGKRRG